MPNINPLVSCAPQAKHKRDLKLSFVLVAFSPDKKSRKLNSSMLTTMDMIAEHFEANLEYPIKKCPFSLTSLYTAFPFNAVTCSWHGRHSSVDCSTPHCTAWSSGMNEISGLKIVARRPPNLQHTTFSLLKRIGTLTTQMLCTFPRVKHAHFAIYDMPPFIYSAAMVFWRLKRKLKTCIPIWCCLSMRGPGQRIYDSTTLSSSRASTTRMEVEGSM